LIGAVQKAGTFYNTNQQNGGFKKLLVSEATALGTQAIQGAIPGAVRAVANRADGWIFPTAQTRAANIGFVQAPGERNRNGLLGPR
jgi:hypothetical protein